MPESTPDRLSLDLVRHVAGTCLCLHTQRAARALARLFDTALAPHGLTHGQFSLMMALNGAEPPTISRLAAFLAMDRTSLTAALKPLERRGLVRVEPSDKDRRARIVRITSEGVAALSAAVPVWRATHALLDAAFPDDAPSRLRADLRQVPSAAAAVVRARAEPAEAEAADWLTGAQPDPARAGQRVLSTTLTHDAPARSAAFRRGRAQRTGARPKARP